MKRFSLVLIGMLVSISLLSIPASAQDVTYTSTADFDGGTKNDPADGNYGVETNTDNLGIAAGSLELSSLKGDSFTLADTDADTFKWNLFTEGTSCSVRTNAIASGVLDSRVVNSGAGGDCRGGVVSSGSVSGDWDARLKVDKTADIGTTSIWELSLFNVANSFCRGVTEDGLHYRDIDGNLQAYTCVNSAYAQIGTNTATPSDPVWLRITRATNTFTFYYSTDGSAWTQDEQTTNANIPNPMYIYATVYADGPLNDETRADFDDYNLAAGTVSAGGFRISGDWISPSFTVPAAQRLSQIELTHSGLSATAYIDLIEVRDSGGAILESFGTDITSGTSTVLTLTGNFDGVLTGRVYLAGNNAGTPTLEAVALTYGADPADPGGGGVAKSPVSVVCDSRWPSTEIVCIGSVNQVWRSAVGGIAGFSWIVDGRPLKSVTFLFSEDGTSDLLVEPDILSIPVDATAFQPTSRTIRVVLFVTSLLGINAISHPETVAIYDSTWVWALYFAIFAVAGLALLSRVRTRKPPSKPPVGLFILIGVFVLFIFVLSGDTRIFWLPAFSALGLSLWLVQNHLVKANYGREE